MFDIGWSELVVVGVIALIVIGPRELPAMMRTIGQMMTKVRRMASEFQGQFQEAMREAELDELRKQAEKLASEASAATTNPVEKATSELQGMIDAPVAPEPAKTVDPAPAAPVNEPASGETKPSEPTTSAAADGGGRAA